MKKSLLKFLKNSEDKNRFKLNNFCSVGWKICEMRNLYPVSWWGFGCTKSGVGYLRVWECQGQWFILGEFLHCGSQKKSHANATKVVLGFFGANFAIFPVEIVTSCQV